MLSQEVDSLLVERQERLQGVQRLQEQVSNSFLRSRRLIAI